MNVKVKGTGLKSEKKKNVNWPSVYPHNNTHRAEVPRR